MIYPLTFRSVVPLFCLLALAGCGGGGTSPNPSSNGAVTVENALTRSDFFDSVDDRYYDIYVCEPRNSGVAEVDMFSDDVDSYLLIYRKNSSGDYDLIKEDDDSGQDKDAFARFDIEDGRTYRIVATSASSDERGDYDIRFSEELGRPARVLPDAMRATNAMKLSPKPTKK
jgi:hypothetical protein